jgi:hypothetical protein
MPASQKGGLKSIEVNPLAVGAVAIVIVLVLGYAFWLRPMQQQSKIEKEWTTPEAAAARGPGGGTKDPAAASLAEQLRQKEGSNRANTQGSRRRE